MTRVTVLPDAEAVARHAAEVLAERIAGARAVGAELHLALAGGSTPERVHELLAGTVRGWDHVHLWLGDERCVPADHEDANQLMVERSLLARLPAGDRPRLHGVRGELGPEDAAWLYGRELVAALGDEPVLDLVVLGMGPDGHTASLFPGHPAAGARVAPVIGVRESPKPPPERITMTLPVLQRAHLTVLVATGEDKREALAGVRDRDDRLPAARVGDGLDEIVCDSAAGGPSA